MCDLINITATKELQCIGLNYIASITRYKATENNEVMSSNDSQIGLKSTWVESHRNWSRFYWPQLLQGLPPNVNKSRWFAINLLPLTCWRVDVNVAIVATIDLKSLCSHHTWLANNLPPQRLVILLAVFIRQTAERQTVTVQNRSIYRIVLCKTV